MTISVSLNQLFPAARSTPAAGNQQGGTTPPSRLAGLINNDDKPVSLAYYTETRGRIDALSRTQPPGKTDEATAASTRSYLLLLMYAEVNREFMGYMAIKNTYGFNEYGDHWPTKDGKPMMIEDMINGVRPDGVKAADWHPPRMPSAEVKAKLVAILKDVRQDEGIKKVLSDHGVPYGSAKSEMTYFIAIYKRMETVFNEYDKALGEYNFFNRLKDLSSKLSKPDIIKLPAKLDYSSFVPVKLKPGDPPGMVEQLEAIDRNSLSQGDREIVNEMIIISTYIMDRYLMAMMSGIKKTTGFDSLGEPYRGAAGGGWPTDSRKAPLSFEQVLALPQINLGADIEANLLAVYRSLPSEPMDDSKTPPVPLSDTYNLSPKAVKYWYFTQVYKYYDLAFVRLDKLIDFDPLARINDVIKTDLCPEVGLKPPGMSDNEQISFIGEVKRLVTPENIDKCVLTASMSWEKTMERWSNYICAVYLALGVDLDKITVSQGMTGRQLVNVLLQRGHDENNPLSTGITSQNVRHLTETVEGGSMNDGYYWQNELILHDQGRVKTKKLIPANFREDPVIEKVKAASGGKIDIDTRVPEGKKVR